MVGISPYVQRPITLLTDNLSQNLHNADLIVRSCEYLLQACRREENPFPVGRDGEGLSILRVLLVAIVDGQVSKFSLRVCRQTYYLRVISLVLVNTCENGM